MIIFAPVNALRAHGLVKAQNEVRYYLSAIHFVGNRIQSCNGHTCLETSHKLVEAPAEGIVLNIATPPTGIRYRTAAIDTEVGIVYWLDYTADKPKDMDGVAFRQVRVAVGTVDVVNASYPNVGGILKKARENSKAVHEVAVATPYLGLIEKLAKKFSIKMPFAKLNFNGTGEPIRVDFTTPDGEATLIIMPARV